MPRIRSRGNRDTELALARLMRRVMGVTGDQPSLPSFAAKLRLGRQVTGDTRWIACFVVELYA